MTEDHPSLAELSRMAQESAEAYLAGDLDTYARVMPHAEDFTLMPPFGGPTRNGFVLDDETRAATRSTFRGGHVEVEVDASTADSGGSCTGMRTRWCTRSVGTCSRSWRGAS